VKLYADTASLFSKFNPTPEYPGHEQEVPHKAPPFIYDWLHFVDIKDQHTADVVGAELDIEVALTKP
jgi:hypothetical protein